MKKFIAIAVCKILRFIGSFIGKGSSLPGEIALKICPDILKRVTLPKEIIAVTGSNGKTSTVEMIAHVLASSGKDVVYNKEGSNQIEGVTTLILTNSTLGGKFKKDAVIIESDERYSKYTFKYFSPTHYVITNLYRDQLTRNGHPQWVFNAVKESISDDCTLVLNADDPLVSLFGKGRENVIWFGMDRQDFSTDTNTGMYDDGKYCPVCNAPMEYDYYHYNHIGAYRCEKCGYKKNDTSFTVTKTDLESGVITINEKDEIQLAFKSIYNVYNILACYAVCCLVGVDGETVSKSISNYFLKNGRVVEYRLGEARGTLITSKHENSVSYDQSLRYSIQQKNPHAVIIIVDAVSRKYYTSETSWLWDINFGMLNTENTEHIYLLGKYANDLFVRFSYTDIDREKISLIENIPQGVETIKNAGHSELYTITCFSDKDKFLSLVEII
ncbi:MAG: MurT ligase domain-containing protein [Acutalibacteraceae bacterium]